MNRKQSYREWSLNIRPEQRFQNPRVPGLYKTVSYVLSKEHCTSNLFRYIRLSNILADLRNNLRILIQIDFGCQKSESFLQKFGTILHYLFDPDGFPIGKSLQKT